MRTTMTKIMMTLLVSIITAAAANAATFTVTNTGNSGAGSLRQALTDANNLAGNDEINFSLTGCPCTITLTSGELLILNLPINNNGSLTINAPGYNVTVSGNNNSRVFTLDSGTTATISGITISGGNGVGIIASGEGGGIYNLGSTLTLIGVTISGNSAADSGGGIFNNSNSILTLRNSTVRDNSATDGGGIENFQSTATINSSIVSGNSAQFGGGIDNISSTVTLNNSTVSGNSTILLAGGIYNSNSTLTLRSSNVSGNSGGTDGGGIYNDSNSTVMLTNSTISGNSARFGGGIESVFSTVTVTNSTISGNSATGGGGGFFNSIQSTATLNNSTVSDNSAAQYGGILISDSGTVTLNNSIVANSTSGDCFTDGGTVNASYSLIESGLTCVNGTNSNNKVGDPNLGPLANNGSQNQSHALLSGSIAIDAGSNALVPAGINSDQRGAQRIIDGDNNGTAIVDMGSYEYLAPTAAGATVSGQVTTGKRGLNKAVVYLQGLDGSMRSMRTNPFGYFQFEDVKAGQAYIVSVMSKQYQFEPQVISISGDLDNLLFTPLGTVNVVKRENELIQ